ncbi:MAG: hypothetical protein ACOX0X_00500 [Candidatus Dojkabacteria bacterium]
MSSNPFISTEVNLKRVGKGVAIFLPCLIMISVIGSYYFHLIDDTLREHYSKEKQEKVLGTSETDLTHAEYIKWFYNEADEIVEVYDFTDKQIQPLVINPEFTYSENKGQASESYDLSTNDNVIVNCPKLESDGFDIVSCNILLNGKEVLTTWGWSDNKTIDPHFTIFDDTKNKFPLLVVGETFRSGSRDNLSVYAIKDGNLENLSFNEDGKVTKTWFLNPLSYMFVENSKEFLVTYFHDPALGMKELIRVWQVGDKELTLTKTILQESVIEASRTSVQRLEDVKQSLKNLIPSQYNISEIDHEQNSQDDGCIFLYEISPKSYTEVEDKYLLDASLMYCGDINKAVLRGQIEEVKYDSKLAKWIYDGRNLLEEKKFGDNLVSITQLGGSHASFNYYISRMKESDEIVVLSVPISNRIRCESYENGVEVIKEDCVSFKNSLNMSSKESDWVNNGEYEEYFKDLLKILNSL